MEYDFKFPNPTRQNIKEFKLAGIQFYKTLPVVRIQRGSVIKNLEVVWKGYQIRPWFPGESTVHGDVDLAVQQKTCPYSA